MIWSPADDLVSKKWWKYNLTPVLLNPDMPIFAKSVDPDQLASDLNLLCLSFSMWAYVHNLDLVIWLADS